MTHVCLVDDGMKTHTGALQSLVVIRTRHSDRRYAPSEHKLRPRSGTHASGVLTMQQQLAIHGFMVPGSRAWRRFGRDDDEG